LRRKGQKTNSISRNWAYQLLPNVTYARNGTGTKPNCLWQHHIAFTLPHPQQPALNRSQPNTTP